MATLEDWALLAIEPTTDADAIRHAYARALKSVDSERDPGGFQALRQAYERILAQQARPAEKARPAPADLQAQADAFLGQLTALRHAGDIDAAIAAVDQLFVARRPGDPLLAAVGDALFRTVALQTSLSARLFCHLVERFEWRDASGPAARAAPEPHSVLLARVAAEDWYQDLLNQAARPGERVAACLVSRSGALPLPPAVLDKAQKEQARALMRTLREHGQFLLERFDARALAALREAVEGPPLVVAPPAPRVPSRAPRASLGRRLRVFARRLILIALALWVGLVVLGLVLKWIGRHPGAGS